MALIYRRYSHGRLRPYHRRKRKGDDIMKKSRIDQARAIRIVAVLIALVNQRLVVFGISPIPFTSAEIEAAVTAVFSVLATLWATWKNNDITEEAHRGTEHMPNLKTKKKRIDKGRK